MILLPSRRRPEHLKRFFTSAKATNTTSPGIVIIDAQDYIANADEYLILEKEFFLPNWKIHISRSESMGDKIRELWPFYKDCEYIGIVNDDHVLVSVEWDKKLISKLDGTNFTSCEDNWVASQENSLPAGATIWSGPLIRAVGYIFPMDLQHTFIDNIWSYLGLETNCWIKDLSVIVAHKHVDKGEAEPDDTHKKMQNFFYTDGNIYVNWLHNESTKAIKAIRDLKSRAVIDISFM